jgi:UDP-N-acetylglucosamine diphosphorylase/glucosamine-1-phosphate N-acetyltransferase
MAAGEWSRMKPLTTTIPKPLIKICGKTIIEHNIESIIQDFDEIYMIVKYKKEKFIEYFGDSYYGKKIHYIDQIESANWTGAAILSLKWHIQWEFVVVSGDDLYEWSDIANLAKERWYATLCKQVDKPENFWIFTCNLDWKPTWIIEKPIDASHGNLANIWNHKFDDKIFADLEKLPLSPRGELEITDLIHKYIGEEKYSVVEAHGRWITIGYPWDLLKANDEIIGNYLTTIDKWAIIEPQVSIKWNIYLEEGAILKSWTYIEWNVYFGKNTIIGPNAYIRWNSSIGSDSKVGAFVEVKNSYIGEDTHIPHLSYIWDSIIWNHVNIGGGSKVANLRHDGTTIRSMAKDTLVNTGRRKLWAIIWDDVHLGIGTLIYPGRSLPSGSSTTPGQIIDGK